MVVWALSFFANPWQVRSIDPAAHALDLSPFIAASKIAFCKLEKNGFLLQRDLSGKISLAQAP